MLTTTAWMSLPSATETPKAEPDHGRHGGELQNWSSFIGITTAIVGNILIALALNVQRYAHTRLHKERARMRQRSRAALKRAAQNGQNGSSYGAIRDDANGHERSDQEDDANFPNENGDGDRFQEDSPLTTSYQDGGPDDIDEIDARGKGTSNYLKSPYWWLGQVLITLGETGNFLAYGFAPASIVSPLGVVALVSNCIIAPVMFHERFRARDFWGIVIAVAGVVTVVLSANQEETKLNPHDVLDAITTMEFEIYVAVTVALIIALMWASSRYGRRTILLDLGLVGLFGGYTALATKGVSSMLSSSLWRAFTTPVTYFLIFILLGTAIMQIRYVNKALQRFDSTQVIPIQFVLFTLCVILGSAVLYRDFEKTNLEQAGKFVGGCLLTFFGVFLITSGRQSNDGDEDVLSETDGVEETINLTENDGMSSAPLRTTSSPKSHSRRSSKLLEANADGGARPSTPAENGPPVDVLSDDPNGSHSVTMNSESDPLLGNPWQGETHESGLTPPRGARTLSVDSAKSATDARLTKTQSNPATPPRDTSMYLYHTENPATPRPGASVLKASGSQNRSRTFISPSPLSSTVTTVVKGGFLRRDDRSLSHTSSMRRIRSSIRASLFFNDQDAEEDFRSGESGGALTSEGHLSLGQRNDEQTTVNDTPQIRSRSLSDTLGDLFRSKKDKDEDLEVGTHLGER